MFYHKVKEISSGVRYSGTFWFYYGSDKRVGKVTDVVKEGDEVKVKVIGFDRGKVKLSIKQAAV